MDKEEATAIIDDYYSSMSFKDFCEKHSDFTDGLCLATYEKIKEIAKEHNIDLSKLEN